MYYLNKTENKSANLVNDMPFAISNSYAAIKIYNFNIDFKIAR